MLTLLLAVLIILWLLGYLNLPVFPITDMVLFNLFGKAISLYDILIFGVILWLIGILPSPFREIAGVLLIIWLLAFFGIIAVAGFSNIVIIALIIGLVLYLLGGFS